MASETRFVRRYVHDFNVPTTKAGYHEVRVPPWDRTPPAPGDIIDVHDGEELTMRCRVRGLFMVVEPADE